ncbi:MAG: hypothetical protein KAU62_06925 [Candidatus Heimdallarchaeota archaeon]|nr:hypothetical protein [Candidatus Heimdallarchaeota archaeon]MCG3255800.1 hypothetical protein [Candidatus Heimdallarchaeota archaeon]MCK4610873.1 hypothetical protein [Candidatus Heimdallarchaeota archaeon]
MLLELLNAVNEGITTVQQFAAKLNMDIDLLHSKIDHCITVGYLTKQHVDKQKSFQDNRSSSKGLSSISCNLCPFFNNCSSIENDNQIFILSSKGKRAIEHLASMQ